MAAAWGSWQLAADQFRVALVDGLTPGLKKCQEAFEAFGRAVAGLRGAQ